MQMGQIDLTNEYPIDIQFEQETVNRNQMRFIHYHDYYEIMCSIHSDNLCFIRDTKYAYKDNTLLFVRPYEVHSIYSKKDTQYARHVLNFDREYILAPMASMDAAGILDYLDRMESHALHLNAKDVNALLPLFMAMRRIKGQRGAMEPEQYFNVQRGYVCVLLMEVYQLFLKSQEPPSVSKPDMLVRDVVQYIDGHYAENIALQSLADRFFVDKFYLSHVFKRYSGTSLVKYIQCRRIIEAQKMLMLTGKSIRDVGFDCGFMNIQHFYRVFKEYAGVTPKQFIDTAKSNAGS